MKAHLDFGNAGIHPVQQLTNGFKGQCFHRLKTRADDDFLSRAPIEAEALEIKTRDSKHLPVMYL